jgi:putative endonuclease
MSHVDLGRLGEDLAEQYFTSVGATLLARNYRISLGELDLVLEHEGDLVAVEVKTRHIHGLGKPEESVTPHRLRRLARTLTTFAVDTGRTKWHWRIDVVAIEVDLDGSVVRFDHIRDAYR